MPLTYGPKRRPVVATGAPLAGAVGWHPQGRKATAIARQFQTTIADTAFLRLVIMLGLLVADGSC
jgi:hypothetical protein